MTCNNPDCAKALRDARNDARQKQIEINRLQAENAQLKAELTKAQRRLNQMETAQSSPRSNNSGDSNWSYMSVDPRSGRQG